MNNKYDIKLTETEKEKLVANVKEIEKYLTELVKDENEIKLEAEWSFADSVWGIQNYFLFVEKYVIYGWNKEHKETITTIRCCINKRRSFEILKETDTTFYLSLLDNWKDIKQQLLAQLETNKQQRQMLKEFVL